jgi:hypothetical protein
MTARWLPQPLENKEFTKGLRSTSDRPRALHGGHHDDSQCLRRRSEQTPLRARSATLVGLRLVDPQQD